MSELAPAVCALVNELWPKYMDTSVYQLVNGAIPETTELLKLQWDHSASLPCLLISFVLKFHVDSPLHR